MFLGVCDNTMFFVCPLFYEFCDILFLAQLAEVIVKLFVCLCVC